MEEHCTEQQCDVIIERFLSKSHMLLLALVCHPRRVVTLGVLFTEYPEDPAKHDLRDGRVPHQVPILPDICL